MEWLCGSAPEKNVQFHVNFNWFSSEIDRDYNISSERFLILDVLEDSIHAGIDKRKLLVAILITLRRSEEKTVWTNRWHSICFRRKSEKKRVNEKLTNKQKVNENTWRRHFICHTWLKFPPLTMRLGTGV